MRWFKSLFMVGPILFALGIWFSLSNSTAHPANQERGLSLVVSPRAIYHYKQSKVTYLIRGANAPVICTGWRYPIYNEDKDQHPYRRSCRSAALSSFTEEWGNFPHHGDYLAFIELYDSFDTIPSRPTLRLESSFKVLEGIPQ